MNIHKKLTPYNYSALSKKENKYIVIHYVGAVSTAKNNVDYYARERLQASAHYFVDEKEIWQSVEDFNSAWHCGGGLQGSGGHKFHGICKNANSIGIEMCVKKTAGGEWYFENKTVENTVELVKYLMKKHNIPVERVIRHYDVTGKICPAPYVNETKWKEFKNKLTATETKETVEVKELTEVNDIVWELANNGIITNKELWLKKLKEDTNAYWLARKTVKKIGELKYR